MGYLGPSWDDLEAMLGHLGAFLGGFRGPFLAVARPGAVLASCRSVLGLSCRRLGAPWARLGAILGHLGVVLGAKKRSKFGGEIYPE